MKRIDWRLVPPLKEGVDSDEGLPRRIEELLEGAGEGEIDAAAATDLARLEDRLAQLRVTPCDAVNAPRVGDDPDWEARVLDEYADSESDLEMEAYLEVRSQEPDCERCPYASPYSLYPMDPCEFGAGGFSEIILDPQLVRRLEGPLSPPEMRALADELERALQEGAWRPNRVVDAQDYLDKAILFLRFWSSHGFSLQPETFPGVEPPPPPEQTEPDEDEGPPTVH